MIVSSKSKPKPAAEAEQDYGILVDTFINGIFYQAESRIKLRPSDAKYYLLGGVIEPHEADDERN